MAIKYLKYIVEFQITLLIYSILLTDFASSQGFQVGVRGTSCNLDPANYNDPCESLYEGICDGAHCKCPPGTHEDQSLKKCAAGPTKKGGGGSTKTSGGGGDLFDLPLDYVPGDKPKEKPKPEEKDRPSPPQPEEKHPSAPVQPPQPIPPSQPAQPAQPRPPVEPQGPTQDPHFGEKTGGGIGGGIALAVLVGLTYYCCKGEKGKALMSKLPFFKNRQTEPSGTNYDLEQQVQQQQSLQDPNAPPPAGKFGHSAIAPVAQ